ncbi:hypothetical protein [Streptomyces sp. HUAS ZL42]|uniref:hypothetical protein n=1 Tax=Streptomyces sp. HUAS ZL42 TaxID=3231715 RepID=UPI00345E2B39
MKQISTVFAAAGAGVVLMAVPAHATWYPTGWPQHAYTSDYKGEGAFQAEGDWVMAADLGEDGRSAVTRWETDYGRSGECKATGGAFTGKTECNYDFAESGGFRMKVCLRNYSNDIGWENCSTWTPWLSISTGNPR